MTREESDTNTKQLILNLRKSFILRISISHVAGCDCAIKVSLASAQQLFFRLKMAHVQKILHYEVHCLPT